MSATARRPRGPDDDAAFAQGLQEGVRLIGSILGQDARADAVLNAAFEGRRLVEQRVGSIRAADRTRLYMANPQLNTYGSGKSTEVIMARCGAINVAREMRGALLSELWMACALYLGRFTDIDMDARVDAFYRRFYGVAAHKQ